RLAFLGDLAPLADQRTFDAALAPLRRCKWVVYAKRPFAGPEAVLGYLARYTHRVAISNPRLIALDEAGVAFKWNDYRIKTRDRSSAASSSTSCPAASSASATTASSPERFAPATSSAPAKRSPRPRSGPTARMPRPTTTLKHLRPRADARVAAAG
ncbi:MAG: transposase, partial [Hyphomicrobiales bacterium]|nr:transposase [Hyphomicrobiales bacterium]